MHQDKLAIQFKGSLFTLTILQIQKEGLDQVETYLAESIKKAPNFFINAPMILDLSDVSIENKVFDKVIDHLRTYNLIPIGTITKDPNLQHHALAKGLAIFPNSKQTSPIKHETKPQEIPSKQKTKQTSALPTKLVLAPVRSGQQIYAKNADLIILNSVSHGAEVIADGNIHIYGTLNGRALAGVNGNTKARIFCKKLNAELISIAGLYQLSDDFKHLKSTEMTQVFLENEKLEVAPLQ